MPKKNSVRLSLCHTVLQSIRHWPRRDPSLKRLGRRVAPFFTVPSNRSRLCKPQATVRSPFIRKKNYETFGINTRLSPQAQDNGCGMASSDEHTSLCLVIRILSVFVPVHIRQVIDGWSLYWLVLNDSLKLSEIFLSTNGLHLLPPSVDPATPMPGTRSPTRSILVSSSVAYT